MSDTRYRVARPSDEPDVLCHEIDGNCKEVQLLVLGCCPNLGDPGISAALVASRDRHTASRGPSAMSRAASLRGDA